jgi:biotin carboxyl carrier protein
MSIDSADLATSNEADVVVARKRQPSNTETPASAKVTASDPIALDSIQKELHAIVASSATEHEVNTRLVDMSCRLTNAIWCGHFKQTPDGMLQCTVDQDSIAEQNLGLATSSLLPTVSATIQSGTACVVQNNELTVITTPVFARQQTPVKSDACLCLALNLGQRSGQSFLLIAQMIATSLSQWHARNQNAQLDWQIDSTAAVAELVSKIVGTDGARKGAIVATNELSNFLNARLVAIGFCQSENSKRTRLQSVSGSLEVDLGGKQAKLLQSALNETLIRGSETTLPAIDGDDRAMKLAHQGLLESHPNCRLVSSPLKTSCGKTIGAWICVLPDDAEHQGRLLRFAKVASSYLADGLAVNRKASLGAASRLKSQTVEFCKGKVGRVVLGCAIAVAFAMLIPITHRVACDCQLQPTVRQFAVAPHDGILLESLVKPGDLVTSGQLLARMDDRELRLELSDLVAQKETALKKRDVSRSARDASETQIAELKIEQLNAQIELIEFKKANLEIKSVVAGIVLQGDLEDALGAPVRTGDVLIEIAPLDKLKLELAVSESDVAYVRPEQAATIVLEGAPFEALKGQVELVRPMSEVRDSKNVFVSEVPIDNDQKLLRPGMQGRAKINAGTRPLGWVLFHRPAERVYSIIR